MSKVKGQIISVPLKIVIVTCEGCAGIQTDDRIHCQEQLQVQVQ